MAAASKSQAGLPLADDSRNCGMLISRILQSCPVSLPSRRPRCRDILPHRISKFLLHRRPASVLRVGTAYFSQEIDPAHPDAGGICCPRLAILPEGWTLDVLKASPQLQGLWLVPWSRMHESIGFIAGSLAPGPGHRLARLIIPHHERGPMLARHPTPAIGLQSRPSS